MITFPTRRRIRALAVLLCPLLALEPAFGRQAGELNLIVVQGDGARNLTQQIPAEPLAVRVEDGEGNPVAGARVVFEAPETGPGGAFPGGLRFETVTGEDGLAFARDFHPNRETGRYTIAVTAQFEDGAAEAAIAQFNSAPRRGYGRILAIIGIVAGAIAAAVAGGVGRGAP